MCKYENTAFAKKKTNGVYSLCLPGFYVEQENTANMSMTNSDQFSEYPHNRRYYVATDGVRAQLPAGQPQQQLL